MEKINAPEAERPTVMVVDDNTANLQSAKNVLSEVCDVFTVPSAEKMFELLKRHTPILILLDINMPNMNGYEALQRLKSDTATSDISVIFLTGVESQESQFEGLSMGAADYIVKPFSPQLLRKRVELHIDLWKQKHLIEEQEIKVEKQAKKLVELMTAEIERKA